jgi:hypothetical protein
LAPNLHAGGGGGRSRDADQVPAGSKTGVMQAIDSMDPLAGYWIFVTDPTDWDAAGAP